MSQTKHVLLVTNATSEEEVTLIKQALVHAKEQGLDIKISLVHVIPNLPTCYFNIPSMVLLTERYYDEAKKSLTTVGGVLGIGKKDQWLITGRIKNEVLRLAQKLGTHFILASSTSIQDLHQSWFQKKEQATTQIRSISSITSL